MLDQFGNEIPPRIKPPMSPDQELTGPFWLIQTYNTIVVSGLELKEAIDQFVRYGLPPILQHGGCFIADSDGVLAIGYNVIREDGEPSVYWRGVTEALDMLRQHRLVEPHLFIDIEAGVGT